MTETDADPPVACTLTEDERQARPDAVAETLVDTYLGAEDREDGVTVRFAGTDDALRAVATFVSNELECCAFADYAIEVGPPYEETRLTVTGPAGTRDLFGEGFVGQLEAGHLATATDA